MEIEFDRDPGLTVLVFVADVAPDSGGIAVGRAVRVTAGMFRGLTGFIHEIDDLGNVTVRQGEPWAWEGR